MSRNMWILAALFAVMAISMIYMSESGQLDRPWDQCKENLVTQILNDVCTPRSGLAPTPQSSPAN